MLFYAIFHISTDYSTSYRMKCHYEKLCNLIVIIWHLIIKVKHSTTIEPHKQITLNRLRWKVWLKLTYTVDRFWLWLIYVHQFDIISINGYCKSNQTGRKQTMISKSVFSTVFSTEMKSSGKLVYKPGRFNATRTSFVWRITQLGASV